MTVKDPRSTPGRDDFYDQFQSMMGRFGALSGQVDGLESQLATMSRPTALGMGTGNTESDFYRTFGTRPSMGNYGSRRMF